MPSREEQPAEIINVAKEVFSSSRGLLEQALILGTLARSAPGANSHPYPELTLSALFRPCGRGGLLRLT